MQDRYWKVLTGNHKGAQVVATYLTPKGLKEGLKNFSPNINLFVRACRKKPATYGGLGDRQARNKRLQTVSISPAHVRYLKPGDFRL